MDVYRASQQSYVAPYTSLITSSMMGKSRLIKEMARYIPMVYLCARSSNSTGYPPRTPAVIEWLRNGLGPDVLPEHISIDKSYFISTLKYSAFLLAIFDRLSNLLRDKNVVEKFRIRELATEDQYTWMWDYFAEPSDASSIEAFWGNVLQDAGQMIRTYNTRNKAVVFYRDEYMRLLARKYKALVKSFEAVGYKREITIILVCDEARRLCEISAADGSQIQEEFDTFRTNEVKRPQYESPVLDNIPFSAFRALRRALRFLSGPNTPVRVFGLFTDTSSRLTNFQPTPAEDRSMRLLGLPLPAPGDKQFDPIFVFTSIDAWSRIYNKCSTLDHVAMPERLVNFGRAGWHTMYDARRKDEASHDSYIDIAKGKLLCYPSSPDFLKPWQANLSRKILLRLLAVLAPRLSITAGPYSLEASEIIASHMAVLVKTDDDRHFLRTVYPSEPILAEASASLTANYGWGRPLCALHHFTQTGIVDAGFRGELLTKIVFLMALDEAQGSIPHDPFSQWEFSRPRRVYEFLDQLISFGGVRTKPPDSTAQTFSDYLLEYSTIDTTNLARFLNGHVFCTHFIRVEYTVSVATLVRAWNRGAAITCQAYNPRFDHIIPVMLEGGDVSGFGDLYDQWNEQQLAAARRSMSYILVDSKNYSKSTNWRTHVGEVEPIESDINGYNLHASLPVENAFISVVQDFGRRVDDEPAVIVEPISLSRIQMRPRQLKQLKIILKGIDDCTYECLKDRPSEVQRIGKDTDREKARMYLAELRNAKVGYFDVEERTKNKRVFDGIVDSLPLISGNEDIDGVSPEWSAEQSRISEKMQVD